MQDVFLLFVDDLNPYEAGLLRDGVADLHFRGFYLWNFSGATANAAIVTDGRMRMI
jgi:hypothetical protein